MQPGDAYFSRLVDFFKVQTDKSRMIGFNSKQKKKAIYQNDLNELNYKDLWDFIELMDLGNAVLYPMEYIDTPQTEEQPAETTV